jgi:transcriptional regulator with XRE-family HTH domain
VSRTTPPLLPRLRRALTTVGDNLRNARLRRAYTTEVVAQRAGITRKTLSRVERGDASVSLGVYARVLQALGLDDDLTKLAADDVLGRRLQDAQLRPRRTVQRRLQHKEVP